MGLNKNPHRLFQADGGLKEGNGSGEPYAHLADVNANMVPRKYTLSLQTHSYAARV